MKYKIKGLISKFIRTVRINKVLFCINKRNEHVNIDEPAVEKATALLEQFSENPKTTSITENIITKEYDLHIIIPAYNAEAYLEKCLDSIFSINVRYSYFVTVVNDGSKDKTKEILQKYKNRRNLLVINQSNRGFSGARNTALKNICGEYIMFVDSDDFIDAKGVEKMLNKAKDKDFDIVEGSFYRVDTSGNIYNYERRKEKIADIASRELYGFPCGKIIKSDLFANVCFPENYWFEDSVIEAIVFPKVKKAMIISDVVYYYRVNPSGISMTCNRSNKAIDSFYIVVKLFEDRKTMGLPITQEYYEHILSSIQITFKRTNKLYEEIQKSIFVLWCAFMDTNFLNMHTKVKSKKELENALRTRNFGNYVAACKYL